MATKIVYVSEGFITKKQLEDRSIPEMFGKLGDVEYSFTEDTAARDGCLAACGGDAQEAMRMANQRLEKEGPNWVRQTPEFLQSIQDADVIVIHYSGAGKQFFEAAKNLKLLCVMRSGVENVDIGEAKKRGIIVTAAAARAADPVADMAVLLMLALMRKLPRDNMAGTGKWKSTPMDEGMMKNSVVGLFGFGNIAQRVAARCTGFGAKFLAYDPWANPEKIQEYGVEQVDSIEELFRRSDFISVHARYNKPGEPNCNYHVIDEKLLREMKPTAYFVNTARAGLVDYDALTRILQEKAIAGAGLDVFDPEPLPDNHPLLLLDNVIVTPHVAGNGGDFILRSIESPLHEIRHYLTDQKFECRKG